MKEGMDRREFLKYSAATGILIAAGESFIESATAEAAPVITEADKVNIWVLAENYYDLLKPDNKVTKRYRSVPGKSIHAEWGTGYYVETILNGQTHACMFDFGLDPAGVMNNMGLLGIDIGNARAFCLSHGHWDHYGSAVSILKQNQSRISGGKPFYVGEEAFEARYALRPGRTEPDDVGQLKKEDVEAIGLRIVEVKTPTEIIPGAYFTGNIERLTSYEKVPPTLLVKRGDKLEQDTFKGEQALFFNVKGRGIVVMTACAHAGMVNTVKQAQKIAGTQKVHAIIGGFHLANAKPEIIQNTVSDIKAMKPDFVMAGHCTGFETILAFSREMPNEFAMNSSGTKYTFEA